MTAPKSTTFLPFSPSVSKKRHIHACPGNAARAQQKGLLGRQGGSVSYRPDTRPTQKMISVPPWNALLGVQQPYAFA